MNDFRTQQAGSSLPRCFTMVDKSSGSGISSGTVNWYLKNISGANAGKWWRNSDSTWQVAETANAMTHQADGHWTITLNGSPWTDGDVSLEYAKESTDLHVPISRMLTVAYTAVSSSSGYVTVGTNNDKTGYDLGSSQTFSTSGSVGSVVDPVFLDSGEYDNIASALLDLSNGVETSVTLRQALRLMVAAAAGKVSGANSSSITFRNIGDTKNRIVATVDAYGNRSAITTDLT